MSTNESNLFDGDCIDLTSELGTRKQTDGDLVLLLDTDKPVEELSEMIDNTFMSPGPNNAGQDKTETPLKPQIASNANKNASNFGYTVTSGLIPAKKKTVVVLSSTLVAPGKPQSAKKPNQQVNMGVSDIVLTPSPTEIRNKKFPTNSLDDDEDVIFMCARQLKTKPADKPSLPIITKPLIAQRFKPQTPQPRIVASVSKLPNTSTVTRPPSSDFVTVTPIAPKAKISVSKTSAILPQVSASTDPQTPVRRLKHVLPKSHDEEKQLVQEIKRAPALPTLKKLSLPVKAKSRDEVLKALREVSTSAVNKPNQVEAAQVIPKKLVQNPFSLKSKVKQVIPPLPVRKEVCYFPHDQQRKTYQRSAGEVPGQLEYSHYVRSEDADDVLNYRPEIRQQVIIQNVIKTAGTQEKPAQSVQEEETVEVVSSAPVVLNNLVSVLSQPQQLPTRAMPISMKRSTEASSSTQRTGQQMKSSPQIRIENVFSAGEVPTSENNSVLSVPNTQINSENAWKAAENVAPPFVAKPTTTIIRKQRKIVPASPVNQPKPVLRNPFNGQAIRSKILQKNASPPVNLTDLAETVSAVANISEESPDGAPKNQILYLLCPVDKATGTIMPFKHGQIQQMMALVPSASGLAPAPQPVAIKNVEEEFGSGDLPLLPLTTKVKVQEPPPPLVPLETPIIETPIIETPQAEETEEDIIFIVDDSEPEDTGKDIEIEPAAIVTPVDISKIIDKFKKPFPKGRCIYHNSDKKSFIKTFKGFTLRERRSASCLREMRAMEKQYMKRANKMRREIFLKYDSHIIFCTSNERDDFLPETVKTEIDEEIEEVEVVTILDDDDDDEPEVEVSGILPTIGEVISQVNLEVFNMQQPRNSRNEGDVPPEEALELIKKGLEMIKNWSQETGTANQLESIIRGKLHHRNEQRKKESVVGKTPKETSPVKRRNVSSKTPEETQPVKRKYVSSKTSEETPPVKRKPGRPKRLDSDKPAPVKRKPGRPRVQKRGRKVAQLDVDNDEEDLLVVKRVDILTGKKIRRRKQTLS